MLLVYISAILTTYFCWVISLFGIKDANSGFTLGIAVILWFIKLFANFVEAIAEDAKSAGRSLRAAKKDVEAYKIQALIKKI